MTEFRNSFFQLEATESTGTAGMDNSFGNTLMIETVNLIIG